MLLERSPSVGASPAVPCKGGKGKGLTAALVAPQPSSAGLQQPQCFPWTSSPPFISSELLCWGRESMETGFLKIFVLV